MQQNKTVEIHGMSGDCMPLSFMREGSVCRVCAVRGNDDTKHHITSLGFVDGALVEIISKLSGSVIVRIKGTTFGIGSEIARRIYVH
ncbi:FeoA family protein [Fannyhessea vaginae]|uniref:FeoA domain protein n=1 Tax=Fannyhessea vaginae DSM 15829 TaxID=525256 RepID=F1T3X9_9ACTN|nr:FeoA family protein [Fannyhessea vaginae]EGF23423.1 FeoA domain protein [Fannyhessea vaginae DSM 15829]QPR41732.1 ferrous iron transport protein A [Fannyhessea vaginae]SSZ04023.1 FeoA domain [Fannyhessea vaginae]